MVKIGHAQQLVNLRSGKLKRLTILEEELKSADYSGMTDQAVTDSINSESITIKISIETSTIKKYLVLVDLWTPLKSSADSSAIFTMEVLEIFDTFDTNEQVVEDKLTAMLDALISVSLINESNKTAILSLGVKTISRAAELGIGKARLGEVQSLRAV